MQPLPTRAMTTSAATTVFMRSSVRVTGECARRARGCPERHTGPRGRANAGLRRLLTLAHIGAPTGAGAGARSAPAPARLDDAAAAEHLEEGGRPPRERGAQAREVARGAPGPDDRRPVPQDV